MHSLLSTSLTAAPVRLRKQSVRSFDLFQEENRLLSPHKHTLRGGYISPSVCISFSFIIYLIIKNHYVKPFNFEDLDFVKRPLKFFHTW